MSLALVAVVALISAPVAAAATEIVYDWDIYDAYLVAPPQGSNAGQWIGYTQPWQQALAQYWIDFTQLQVYMSNYQTQNPGTNIYQGSQLVEYRYDVATLNGKPLYVPAFWAYRPNIPGVSSTFYDIGVVHPVNYTFEPGHVYDISLEYYRGGHWHFQGKPLDVNLNTQQLGFWAGLESGNLDTYYDLTVGGTNYPGSSGNAMGQNIESWQYTLMVGANPVYLTHVQSTTMWQNYGNWDYANMLVGGVPVTITVTEKVPEAPSDTDKIIAAVESTGDRIIAAVGASADRITDAIDASGKRTVDAIDRMADRLDPQDKPPLADLNPKEPDPLPELPTLPTPEEIIGAEGLAALKDFWDALSGSTFGRIAIMGPIGVAFALGYIAYVVRKKREE